MFEQLPTTNWTPGTEKQFFLEHSRRREKYEMFHGHRLPDTQSRPLQNHPELIRLKTECKGCGGYLVGLYDKKSHKYRFEGAAHLYHCR